MSSIFILVEAVGIEPTSEAFILQVIHKLSSGFSKPTK